MQPSTGGATGTDQGAVAELSRAVRNAEEAYDTLKRDNAKLGRDNNIMRQNPYDDMVKARQDVNINQDRIDELWFEKD